MQAAPRCADMPRFGCQVRNTAALLWIIFSFHGWEGAARPAAGGRERPYPQYTVVSNMIHRPELSWSYRKTSGEVACAKPAVSQRLSC